VHTRGGAVSLPLDNVAQLLVGSEARLPAMSMDHTNAMFFEDDNAFEAWLVDNASTASHVWVRMAKKGTGVT
jgi:hypothetical protein